MAHRVATMNATDIGARRRRRPDTTCRRESHFIASSDTQILIRSEFAIPEIGGIPKDMFIRRVPGSQYVRFGQKTRKCAILDRVLGPIQAVDRIWTICNGRNLGNTCVEYIPQAQGHWWSGCCAIYETMLKMRQKHRFSALFCISHLLWTPRMLEITCRIMYTMYTNTTQLTPSPYHV